jgi:Stage II sporulation protein E (SpoIIE)
MKRVIPFAACAAGILALVYLMPWFNAAQPAGARITRGEAERLADAEARRLGIPVDRTSANLTWTDSPILEKELEKNPDRRRSAQSDPVIGPRLGAFRRAYYRPGREKYFPWGDVSVDPRTGQAITARKKLLPEDKGVSLTEAQLRPRADQFAHSRVFEGAPNPQFESARPTVLRYRTDWVFRYRVPSKFTIGDVVPYLYVYFAGDQPTGWALIEEYSDGRTFNGDSGSDIIAILVRLALVYILLMILLGIFLRKYHAGEVGVGTASLLFAAMVVLCLVSNTIMGPNGTEGDTMGNLDFLQTTLAQMGFKFVAIDLPLAVLVFFAWSVGESYARERWGERLASFDAILRRDPVNATVGHSLLHGVLTAPAIAACALGVGLIPLLLHYAYPSSGPSMDSLYLGGPILAVTYSASDAIIYSVIAILFFLAFAHRKRMLWVGALAALILGAVGGACTLSIAPLAQRTLFGFGGIAAAIAVFLAYDLLATAVGLFLASLLMVAAPLLSVAKGALFVQYAMVVGVPTAVIGGFALIALWTGREVVYAYEDLAPHVKRIVERERVKAEIDAANRIQSALLPQGEPTLVGATVASHYRAATEIGGDYFDFLPQPTGEIGIAFGDVSGHGLTSGIVMAMAKSALLVQVGYDASPRAVMNVLNDIVMRTAPKRILMTFFFGLLDPHTQTLRFSSAGHLDPYVYRASTGKLETLSSWGFPLGVKRREPFREHSVDFAAGDRLVLYSDGLIECIDDDGEPYGFDRFENTITRAGHLSAEEIKKTVLNSVRKFTRNRPPEDDQTLVVVSFDGAVSEALQPPVIAAYSEHVN